MQVDKVLFGTSNYGSQSKYTQFEEISQKKKPWFLSQIIDTPLSEIRCGQTLEYMTFMEVDSCLNDWYCALKIKGEIVLEVPNSDFFAQLWLDAEWTEEELRNPSSLARMSRSGLYGVQSRGNPKDVDYDPSYSEVVKTPFNNKYLSFLLRRAGFEKVDIVRPNPQTLLARAVKSMDKSERQVAPEIEQIRTDHRKRYEFAATRLNKGDEILDFACGIGYGAKIISDMKLAKKITACDLSHEALEYAECHYHSKSIQYLLNDALDAKLPKESFDLAISFETIEHLEKPERFLRSIHLSLKEKGILICSVPNEKLTPFDKNTYPYHFRHYTLPEIKTLLKECGFCMTETFCQKDLSNPEISKDADGSSLILIATKE